MFACRVLWCCFMGFEFVCLLWWVLLWGFNDMFAVSRVRSFVLN